MRFRSLLRLVTRGQCLAVCLLSCCLSQQPADAQQPDKRIQFNRDVRPLISDRCFHCHGPDSSHREGGFRIDIRDSATGPADSGETPITPGSLDTSELIRRITSTDPDEQMPPAHSEKPPFSPEEIEILRRWIQQGAPYQPHWSLIPPVRASLPQVRDPKWVRNPIDTFILARLERERLRPSKPADKEILIRRLSLDLTGLPPTRREIDEFLADSTDSAYERLVDRLLASKRYGERMAVHWLDLARYADTYGYQADVYRPTWPWRDWVIQSFNENLPYDQFISWQIAGDLLPNATRSQILATAFQRHHRQTNEGGSIEQEYRTEYAADRTDTFGTAFLGMTIGCARCHDHKYDPISQQEYYQLFAFFNSIDESGLYSHFTNSTPTPTLLLTPTDRRAQLEAATAKIRQLESRMSELAQERTTAFHEWLATASGPITLAGLIGDFPMESFKDGKLINRAGDQTPGTTEGDPVSIPGKQGRGVQLSGENQILTVVGGKFTRNDRFSISVWVRPTQHHDRAVIYHRSRAWTDAGSRGYQLLIEEGRLSASLIHFWPGNAIRIRTQSPLPVNQWSHVVMTYDGSSRANGLAIYVNGQAASCETIRDHLYKNITGGGVSQLAIGKRFRDRGFKNGQVDELKIFARQLTPIEVEHLFDGKALEHLIAKTTSQPDQHPLRALLPYYLANHDPVYRELQNDLDQARRQRSKLTDSIPEIMVMRELPHPRPTYLLVRGAYDNPGAEVQRNTPDCFPSMPTGAPANRLGLAQWLVAPNHPLTARVAVNRFWQQMFGRGLVATPEDFGNQGQMPSHPELLDWLAVSFVESGWDVKQLLKRIAMSATYRQSSECAPELRQQDPDNILLARGVSYRLSAEMIRDSALFASGLLDPGFGGPPVKPYQPPGLWLEKSGQRYQRDVGPGSHRRSIYTYWKRTSPPPAMLTFDAAKRDVCVIRRQTTATPLQALVLLNDPQFVEAARGLAERVMIEQPDSLEQQLTQMFRLLTSKYPTAAQLNILTEAYRDQQQEFRQHPNRVETFLAIGDHQPDVKLNQTQLAALTVVAQMLLNYHDTVSKR